MKGSSRRIRVATVSSRTSRREAMSAATSRTASASRKASGSTSRRLAESSRLRSSHWVAAVSGPLRLSTISRRARAHIRSARIGLRL